MVVEKKVKKINPEFYTCQAVKKKQSPLFGSARTRKSKEVQMAKDCKKTITKEEKRKLSFTQFDVTREEY